VVCAARWPQQGQPFARGAVKVEMPFLDPVVPAGDCPYGDARRLPDAPGSRLRASLPAESLEEIGLATGKNSRRLSWSVCSNTRGFVIIIPLAMPLASVPEAINTAAAPAPSSLQPGVEQDACCSAPSVALTGDGHGWDGDVEVKPARLANSRPGGRRLSASSVRTTVFLDLADFGRG